LRCRAAGAFVRARPNEFREAAFQLAQLGQLLAHLRTGRQEGASLHLRYAAEAQADLENIISLESECCEFLGFDLSPGVDYVDLTVTAPEGAVDFARALFGRSTDVGTVPGPICPLACGCKNR
jgi:hypothetical protein